MLKRLSFVIFLILIGAAINFAQPSKVKRVHNGERLITDMARSQNMPPIVGDVGVFANTLLNTKDAMPPEVSRILNLKEKVIPLLIAHLDDMRLTRMSYCCNEQPQLTVADACLNILTHIVKPAPPMFDKKCVEEEDDKTGCLNEEYYFYFGTSYVRRGKLRVIAKEVRTAKQNWLKAYRKHQIQYIGYD